MAETPDPAPKQAEKPADFSTPKEAKAKPTPSKSAKSEDPNSNIPPTCGF